MIRLRDSLTLALTKLRTRKVRLMVTIIVSGLLFCGLTAASLVVRGAFHSIDSFNKEGFGSRYIVQGFSQGNFVNTQDAKIIDRAVAIQKDLITRKKAAAKTLGVEYDASTEQSPVQEYDYPGGKQRNLDMNQPAAQQAVKELSPVKPTGVDDMKKAAAPFQGQATYQSQIFTPPTNGSSLQVLKNGKETYGGATAQFQNGPPTGTDSFTTLWTLASGKLMQPFLLKGSTLDDKGDGSIPIVVPVSAAEQLLNLKELPGSAKPDARLARMKLLRQEAARLTFQVCYRNGTSAGLVNTAVSTAQQVDENKNKKDYQKPDLIYGIPAQPCGTVAVTRDVRDADTKALAAKQDQFDAMFGKVPASEQTLNFRVVGLSPDIGGGAALGVSQVVSSLVTSSLGSGWFTPQEYAAKAPLLDTLFSSAGAAYGSPPSLYEEFATADQARHFIDAENCQPDYGANGPSDKCIKANKPFSLNPYGSNSLALESAQKSFNKIFSIATLVAAIIAAIIMMGTVGRMIADSRRETAVFRAIGAKKLDIAQIYVLYTVLLAVLICIFAVAVGVIVAAVADHKYGPQATVQALVAYNSQDLTRKFTLFNFYIVDMLRLVGLILAASIISSVLPLFRNLRRNPIRDMRDDT